MSYSVALVKFHFQWLHFLVVLFFFDCCYLKLVAFYAALRPRLYGQGRRPLPLTDVLNSKNRHPCSRGSSMQRRCPPVCLFVYSFVCHCVACNAAQSAGPYRVGHSGNTDWFVSEHTLKIYVNKLFLSFVYSFRFDSKPSARA